MSIVTFDIGTTAIKGALLSEDGNVLASASENVNMIVDGDYMEQSPDEWYEVFCKVCRALCENGKDTITSVIMSGQMQDLIMVDANNNAIGNAILYCDGRASEEAEHIVKELGEDYLLNTTGNGYDGSLPAPKLLWVKNNRPDMFDKIAHVLISAKDYIILKLTGEAVGDVTACATAGAMVLKERRWDDKIIRCVGADKALFPKLLLPGDKAGAVTQKAASECGINTGVTVYAGIGDAGATTLASGIANPGEYNINLGTSGWIATVSDNPLILGSGVFNLGGAKEGTYINVVPFLNAANIHRWITSVISAGDEELRYDTAESLAAASVPGSNGVFCLPYLSGERFPVMDKDVRGSFLGVSVATNPGDMVRSCLEGVAFSIRQGMETIGLEAKSISVIGGGGRVKLWNQIMSEVLNDVVTVYGDSDLLPAYALAAIVLEAEGKIKDYAEFTDLLKNLRTEYKPLASNAEAYNKIYEKYKTIFPILKGFYS